MIGKIEILIDGVWVDRTQDILGLEYVPDSFYDAAAQRAVFYNSRYYHSDATVPDARLVWTEITPTPGGPQ